MAMAVTMQDGESAGVLRLEGTADIASAAELKQALLQLRPAAGMRVEIAAGTEMDLTAMQLLMAAKRAARSAGAVFDVICEQPEAVRAALAEAGLQSLLDGE
jgi:anti-anti-sigma factor